MDHARRTYPARRTRRRRPCTSNSGSVRIIDKKLSTGMVGGASSSSMATRTGKKSKLNYFTRLVLEDYSSVGQYYFEGNSNTTVREASGKFFSELSASIEKYENSMEFG